MVVHIHAGTIPIKSAIASIDMRPLAAMRTELTFTMNFVPKMGPIGHLLAPLMKPAFRNQIGKLLTANRTFVEARAMTPTA